MILGHFAEVNITQEIFMIEDILKVIKKIINQRDIVILILIDGAGKEKKGTGKIKLT